MDDQLYRGDDGTALRFYYEAVKNNFLSEKLGQPTFDKGLFVDVITPGSTESSPKVMVERTYHEDAKIDAPERTEKYVMYQKQIDAFKNQTGEGVNSGLPLAQWPQVDVAQVATLKAQGIHTVEMLASVSDTNLSNLGMGARLLRDQAAGFLQSRQFSLPSAQMAAETADLRSQVAALTTSVDDLAKRLSAAQAENMALHSGNSAPTAPSQSANVSTDPLGFETISKPNPLASLDPATGSPLTPTEGEASENAKNVPQPFI